MSLIKTLKDNEGNIIYPQTSTKAIYNTEGKTLDEILENGAGSGGGNNNTSIDGVEVGQIVLVNGELNDPRFLPCDGRILDADCFPEIADILPRTWSDPVAYTSTLPTSCTKLFWAYDKLWACGTVGNTGSNPLYYSEDYGKTWLTANLSSLTNTATHNLVYSNGCMVLTPTAARTIASQSTCFYSFDGVNWTEFFLVAGGETTNSKDTTTYVRHCKGYWADQIIFVLNGTDNNDVRRYIISTGVTEDCDTDSSYTLSWTGGVYPHETLDDVAVFGTYRTDGKIAYISGSITAHTAYKNDAAYSFLRLDNKYVGTSRWDNGTTIGNWIYGESKAFPSRTDFLNNTNSIATTNNPNSYVKLPNGDYCSISTTTFNYYKPKRYKMLTTSTTLGSNINEYMKVSSSGDYKLPYKIYKGHFMPAFQAGDFNSATGAATRDGVSISHTSSSIVLDYTEAYKVFDHSSGTTFNYSGTTTSDQSLHTITIDLGEEIILGKIFCSYSGISSGTGSVARLFTISRSLDGATYTQFYSNNSDYSTLFSTLTINTLDEFNLALSAPAATRYIQIKFQLGDKASSNPILFREFDIIEWAKKEA